MADWPFQSACAINGAPYPKHAQWGIDPEVFDATLAGLDATGRRKFERRMCSNAVQLQAYQALPARPLGEIRAELQAIDASIGEECSRASMALVDQAANTSRPRIMWTQAIISENDRIIPTVHQLA